MTNKRFCIKMSSILPGCIELLTGALLIYEGWYLEKYTAIPGVLQILALMIIGLTAILIMRHMKQAVNSTIVWWGVFGLYSLVSAWLIGANMYIVTDALFTYFSFIAVTYCAGVVSSYTKNYVWFSKTIMIVCMMCAVSALSNGVQYKNGEHYVITMSNHNNPNTLGLIMAIGIFILLFYERNNGLIGRILRIIFAGIFFIVTVNTGSRSALLCAVAVIGIYIYSLLKNTNGKILVRILKRMFVIIAVCSVVMIAVQYLLENNISGSGINRLFEKMNGDSFSGRTDLYVVAWQMFLDNMLFGVGYKCFASLGGFGYYTHSTYIELLSCTGIIGFVLFMVPIISGLKNAIRFFKNDNGRGVTILMMMIVSGFFGIVYYGMVFLMVLYMEMNRIPTIRNSTLKR